MRRDFTAENAKDTEKKREKQFTTEGTESTEEQKNGKNQSI
jgi:hypothetical protein